VKHCIGFALALGAAAFGCAAALAAEPYPNSGADFAPHDGLINPGRGPAPWSATKALPQDRQPDQEEARAALIMPDPVGVVSAGQQAAAPNANPQQTIGVTPNQDPQQTTGVAPPSSNPPPGPIASTLQTIPAKYSHRNDLLDHLPVMAWPLLLNEQQRQEIVTAVMTQTTKIAVGVDELKPAASVTYEQSRQLSALPDNVAKIEALRGLKYLKGKNKVLLVQPSTGIVVDQISM
jgi:hypothetical protein